VRCSAGDRTPVQGRRGPPPRSGRSPRPRWASLPAAKAVPGRHPAVRESWPARTRPFRPACRAVHGAARRRHHLHGGTPHMTCPPSHPGAVTLGDRTRGPLSHPTNRRNRYSTGPAVCVVVSLRSTRFCQLHPRVHARACWNTAAQMGADGAWRRAPDPRRPSGWCGRPR